MSALSSVNCVSGAVAFSTMSDSASGTGRADGRGGEAIPRKLKAEAYLKRVKEVFKVDPKLRIQYKEFLEVNKLLLITEKIDTRKLLVRVRVLLIVHKDLIDGFNEFLPKGCEKPEMPTALSKSDFKRKLEKMKSLVTQERNKLWKRHPVEESLVDFEWTVDYARRSGGDLRATMEALLSSSSW
ncbi:unnamed protein product [Calypogeia fissa]